MLGLQRIKPVHFTLIRPTRKISCNDTDFGNLILSKKIKLILRKRTAATRDRTKDLQIFSLTLSQLSYHGTYKIGYECKHFVNESRLRCNQDYFKRRVPWSTSIYILHDVYDMSVWKYFINVMIIGHTAISTFENVYTFRTSNNLSCWLNNYRPSWTKKGHVLARFRTGDLLCVRQMW